MVLIEICSGRLLFYRNPTGTILLVSSMSIADAFTDAVAHWKFKAAAFGMVENNFTAPFGMSLSVLSLYSSP